MKILFNAVVCGLGDNGGSKTIVTSCEYLNKLPSVHADIATSVNNYKFTEFSNVIIVDKYHLKDLVKKNSYDVIINVSVWDVETTLSLDAPLTDIVWWIRGVETWVRGEEFFYESIRRFHWAGGNIFVNSTWLIDHIYKKTSVLPTLQFSGVDYDEYYETLTTTHTHFDKIVIGGLWSDKHKTKNYAIFKAVTGHFGTTQKYKPKTLRGGIYSHKGMRNFYNSCDIWLALSSSEGFHLCPIEAALCGCLVIYNDIESGGTFDYCNPKTAMPFTTMQQLTNSILAPEFGKVEVMEEYLEKNIPSKTEAMENFISKLEAL